MSAIEESGALAKFDRPVNLVNIILIDDTMVARRFLLSNMQECAGTVLVQTFSCSNVFRCI